MRVADLPNKLPPGMQLFPPLMANQLASAPGGLDLGLPRFGVVPFEHLAAAAACVVPMEGADVPLLLLFVGGERRPFAVYATKVRRGEFGLDGPPHRPENLRALILHLAERAPHLVVDSATLEFLRGRMLRPLGDRLGDLADAIGLILVNREPLREVDLGPSSPSGSEPRPG